jgi:hypothetical protein
VSAIAGLACAARCLGKAIKENAATQIQKRGLFLVSSQSIKIADPGCLGTMP